jgi:hypothetical protein
MTKDFSTDRPELTAATAPPEHSPRLHGSLLVQAATRAEAARYKLLAEVLIPGRYGVSKQSDGRFIATELRVGLITKDTAAAQTADVSDMLQPGQSIVRYRDDSDNVMASIVGVFDSERGSSPHTIVRILTTSGTETNFDLALLGRINEGRGWLLPVPEPAA